MFHQIKAFMLGNNLGHNLLIVLKSYFKTVVIFAS